MEPTGRQGRDIVLFGSGDRLIMKLVFLAVLIGFPLELSGPTMAGVRLDVLFAVAMAALAWLAFRVGFRTQVAARADHLEVVNPLTTDRIPYDEVVSIELDWLSIRITLPSGRHVRVWGLSDSLLATRGGKGQELVDRLGAIVAARSGGNAPEYTRTRFADWGVYLAILLVFAAAIAYRLLTE